VLGIVGIIIPMGLVLAVTFGFIGKSQINRSNGTQRGRGLAIAGIVLGLAFIALYLLVVTLFVLTA
jgi:4-amino-4-deoxy-L-arabinose transferase-like glycosyltransferase